MGSRKDSMVAPSARNSAGKVVSDSHGNRVWKWVTHNPGSKSRLLARLNDNDLALAESGAHGVSQDILYGGDPAAY